MFFIKIVAASALGASVATGAVAQDATNPAQIEHDVAKVDAIRCHYVTIGTGDPVLLIPGWPESWISWRKVVPLLVRAGHRVVVLDPRKVRSPLAVTITTLPHATCMTSS